MPERKQWRSSPRIRPQRRIQYKVFLRDTIFGTIYDVFEEIILDQGACTFGQVLKQSGHINFSDSIPWPWMRRRFEEKHETTLIPLSRDRNRTLVPAESAGSRAPVGYCMVDKRQSAIIQKRLDNLNKNLKAQVEGGTKLIGSIRKLGIAATAPTFVAGAIEAPKDEAA